MEPGLVAHIASLPTLRAAFARVRDHHGCAGADGVSIADFERDLDVNLFALHEALERGTYRPFPLLRILVDRGDGSGRQLCIPAVRDRVAQAAALAVLNPLFEAEFEQCSFGYRRGRSVHEAVHQIKQYYEQGYRWVVEADVDAFFDSVDQSLLLLRLRQLVGGECKAQSRKLKARDSRAGEASGGNDPAFSFELSACSSYDEVVQLIAQWVRAQVWDGSQLYRMERGIPQGAVISPALANLFLDDLDEALLAAGQKLVRYADDFVILCRDRQQAERAAQLTDKVLDSLHLELDDAAITTFDAGFTFLGVTFMRSLILEPYDRPKREKRVIFMPPPIHPDEARKLKDER